MGDLEFTQDEWRSVYEALMLHAHGLIGTSALAGYERVATSGECGETAEDLAGATFLAFINPENRSVKMKSDQNPRTVASVIAYLKKVQYHDFLDEKKRAWRRVPGESLVPPAEGSDTEVAWEDQVPIASASPEDSALLEVQRQKVLAHFEPFSDLYEIVELMFDPDFHDYKNADLAILLNTTVSEIENRKKKITRHFAVLTGRQRP